MDRRGCIQSVSFTPRGHRRLIRRRFGNPAASPMGRSTAAARLEIARFVVIAGSHATAAGVREANGADDPPRSGDCTPNKRQAFIHQRLTK